LREIFVNMFFCQICPQSFFRKIAFCKYNFQFIFKNSLIFFYLFSGELTVHSQIFSFFCFPYYHNLTTKWLSCAGTTVSVGCGTLKDKLPYFRIFHNTRRKISNIERNKKKEIRDKSMKQGSRRQSAKDLITGLLYSHSIIRIYRQFFLKI
jgi:hypothetical protein